MARKTVSVESVKNTVNEMLANPNVTFDARVSVSVLLESVLMDTDNYKGFRYLEWDYGQNRVKVGSDDFRRFYY